VNTAPEHDYDVIVIGSGLGGHSAASSAAEGGGRVVVLEAAQRVGGTSAMSGGAIYAAGTQVQRAAGVVDSPDALYEHYMTFNHWLLDPSIVRRYCDEAPGAIDWLINMGVRFPPEKLYQAGVELGRRGHSVEGQGSQLMETIHGYAAGLGVEFITNTRVARLLTENGGVCGVHADGVDLTAGAVVIASGGLGGNVELLKRYYPDAAKWGAWHQFIGSPEVHGDSIVLGLKAGSAVAHSTLNRGVLLRAPNFGTRDVEGFMPNWLFLVNREGRRFADETAPYAVMDGIINAQTDQSCWAIMDQKIFLAADGKSRENPHIPGAFAPNWDHETLRDQLPKGKVIREDNLESLAVHLGVNSAALRNNIARYNRYVENGHDEQFFKEMKGAWTITTPPFYAVELKASVIVNSAAGLEVDAEARVENEADEPIPGLYAVGEAAGGVVGKYLGGGNTLGAALIFGRIAGRHAMRHIKNDLRRTVAA
jgi:fumarate reductase flavoprotein subunit